MDLRHSHKLCRCVFAALGSKTTVPTRTSRKSGWPPGARARSALAAKAGARAKVEARETGASLSKRNGQGRCSGRTASTSITFGPMDQVGSPFVNGSFE